jgi:hypothetical protein
MEQPADEPNIFDEWIDTPEGERELTEWARSHGFTEEELVEWAYGNQKLKAYFLRRWHLSGQERTQ